LSFFQLTIALICGSVDFDADEYTPSALANADSFLLEVQRLAGFDVDHPDRATFDEPGLRGLVDGHAPDQLRREQRVAHAAAAARDVLGVPVAARHGVAVQRRECQGVRCATQAHAVVFAEAALGAAGRGDVDARYALQRVGDVLVGHLADVFGGDYLHHRVGVPLLVDRLLQRTANAGDDHGLQLLGLGLGGRGSRRGRLLCLNRQDGAHQ
jgi:hypothetical protein